MGAGSDLCVVELNGHLAENFIEVKEKVNYLP